MRVLVIFAIFACVYASEDIVDIAAAANEVEVAEAQFNMMNPMMGGMPMGGMNSMNMGGMPMGGMNGMNMGGNSMMMNPMMGGMSMGMDGQDFEGYQTDYSLSCSNSCSCRQQCVPMMQCHCVCPPRCPPSSSPPVEGPPANRCDNGAPDFTHPGCCWNGGSGDFCCRNGANNLHCCLNEYNNPWCGPVERVTVVIPPVGTPAPTPPSNDCNRCVCQPCIPWVPCPPCPCQSRCGGGGWGK